jgi:hypothetical protein
MFEEKEEIDRQPKHVNDYTTFAFQPKIPFCTFSPEGTYFENSFQTGSPFEVESKSKFSPPTSQNFCEYPGPCSISQTTNESVDIAIYDCAVAAVEKYQRALQDFQGAVEMSRVSQEDLESQRAALSQLHMEAHSCIQEYEVLYTFSIDQSRTEYSGSAARNFVTSPYSSAPSALPAPQRIFRM